MSPFEPSRYVDPPGIAAMVVAHRNNAERSQKIINAAEIAASNVASQLHACLRSRIEDFDANLDDAQEVGVRLVSFGQTFTFSLESMTFDDPSLIYFAGTSSDGNRVELIQNIHQLSVLLMALPRHDPTQPKEPFGFSKE